MSSPSPSAGSITLEDLFAFDMPDLTLPGFMLENDINLSPVASPRLESSPQLAHPLTPQTIPITELREESQEEARDSIETDIELVSMPNRKAKVARTQMPSQLKRSLSDVSTVLTEFYFKEAASLYSVYDSPMNPFRSTVAQLWGSSRLLHCTLQSMSAACLLDSFPNLAVTGRELRKEALTILKNQKSHDHASLLALLMLGGSSSWHNTSRTGAEYFNLARERLNKMVDSGQLPKDSNNYHFFEEALIYWELLLTYVDDNVLRAPIADESSQHSIYFPSRHIPHPWTGIARDTQVTVQEVGRLVRRCRILARSGQYTTTDHINELQRSLVVAKELESKLLTFVYPDEKDVVSPGDRVTPVWHLLTLAEVYRRTGLAQLYRVFPDLLDERLQTEEDVCTLPHSREWLVDGGRTKRNEWLTTHVLETLKMLETIPIESGTRDFQPFLLVALCSELRMPTFLQQAQSSFAENEAMELLSSPRPTSTAELHDQDPEDRFTPSVNQSVTSVPELSMRSIDIIRSRKFVLDRLNSFIRILPPKPMKVCIQIVQNSWARIDRMQISKASTHAPQRDIYWMDVMMDNNWETCMA